MNNVTNQTMRKLPFLILFFLCSGAIAQQRIELKNQHISRVFETSNGILSTISQKNLQTGKEYNSSAGEEFAFRANDRPVNSRTFEYVEHHIEKISGEDQMLTIKLKGKKNSFAVDLEVNIHRQLFMPVFNRR